MSNLPPGCGMLPGEEDTPPCDICHGDAESGKPQRGGCICPECPTCGVHGDPSCINTHASYKIWPSLNGDSPRWRLEAYRENQAIQEQFEDEASE